MNKKKTVVVMGPYRSGTSLASRVLQQFGISAGPEEELYEATDWNPSGYIQRPDVTRFNTRLIGEAGGNLTEPGHPETIAAAVGHNFFTSLDLSWMDAHESVLIKDPRFCYTLYAWQKHLVLSNRDVFVVRVSRTIDAAAMSGLAHYDVKHYCGNTLESARRVIQSYDDFAAWHLDKLQLPAFHLIYELLVTQPERVIENLAAFFGVSDSSRIQSALTMIGEGKSRINTGLDIDDNKNALLD